LRPTAASARLLSVPRPIPLLLLALLACNGPFGLLPGGSLEGNSAPAPADWSFAGDYGTAQLETRPGDPYSVNLAYTVMDGRLYVNAGDSETRWVENMSEDPRVRLRLDDVIYDLRAERVTDAGEIRAFGRAWTRQSLFRRDPAGLEVVYLYRLVSR
jgi:hypothetical protein